MKIICKCTVTRFGGGCAFILLRYIPINSVVHVVHSLPNAPFWCAFISSIILPPFLHLLLPTSQALPSHFNYLTACCLNFHWSLCLPIYQSTHLTCIQLTLARLVPTSVQAFSPCYHQSQEGPCHNVTHPYPSEIRLDLLSYSSRPASAVPRVSMSKHDSQVALNHCEFKRSQFSIGVK